MRTWRVVGISFEHMHMGDLLREVFEHPAAEIAGGLSGRSKGEDQF